MARLLPVIALIALTTLLVEAASVPSFRGGFLEPDSSHPSRPRLTPAQSTSQSVTKLKLKMLKLW